MDEQLKKDVGQDSLFYAMGVSCSQASLNTAAYGATLNVSCIDIERAKHLVLVYVVVPLMNYMSTKFKGAHNIFVIFF
jgi:hypothetical protein